MSSTAVATLPDRAQVTAALKKHFFLRVHMFVILGGTISVALLTTKILLITHEHNLSVRYGIAIVLAPAVALGWYAQKNCPSAAQLHDALRCSVTTLR